MSKFFKWLKKDPQPEKSSDTTAAPSNKAELEENVSQQASTDQPKSSVVEEAESVTSAQANELEVEQPSEVASVEKTPDTVLEPNISTDSQAEIESTSTAEANIAETPEELPSPQSEETERLGFFNKLKRSLSRTKESIGSGIVSLFRGKSIDDELFEELETQLLVADVGMNTTLKIIQQLTESSSRQQLKDGDALYQLLKQQMADILHKVEAPLDFSTQEGPFVILMVGVNGVGKTTTIGKMAKQFQQQGKKVMLAAGDTFRAAAVEQLQVWGERNDIPVVAQQTGSDSASVIFDAFQSAKARNIDVLIADTAGRLQNKDHLMEELKKVVRVMKKISPQAPHEIMLTLDAGTGQNAVSQTKLFHEAVGLTGISLTKLDGTAKGGVIFAIADQFDIPIRYVGIGEGIDDLRPFNSHDFVDALFAEPTNQSPGSD
ncbi:signal recognition particle-docking protein FtsY [Paraglaciecola aestuariivivens]